MRIEPNRSKTYIIPLLNQQIYIHKGLLVNTYLFDLNRPDYNLPDINGIFLMFKWATNEMEYKYEKDLFECAQFVEKYEVSENYYMVFMKISLDIASDVKLILDGKYSKIHDASKQTILKFWNQNTNSKIYKILYKKDSYKKELEDMLNVKLDYDVELGSTLDLHKETFNYVIKPVESN
jgi:hypothetical protein